MIPMHDFVGAGEINEQPTIKKTECYTGNLSYSAFLMREKWAINCKIDMYST